MPEASAPALLCPTPRRCSDQRRSTRRSPTRSAPAPQSAPCADAAAQVVVLPRFAPWLSLPRELMPVTGRPRNRARRPCAVQRHERPAELVCRNSLFAASVLIYTLRTDWSLGTPSVVAKTTRFEERTGCLMCRRANDGGQY